MGLLELYLWFCTGIHYCHCLHIYILDKDIFNKIKDINQNIYKIINKNHKHDTTK